MRSGEPGKKHARLLKETSKLSDATRKYGATGDKPHVAAAQWRSATSPARVDKTGSQSRVISKFRCRAKLHGIFKHAQRQSRDGRFYLHSGCSDQLVGSQISRLSSCGVVILSEFLSPNFDLNSSTVRNVLRGWIAHGDAAAVWMTQALMSSTSACLFENMSSSKCCWFLRGAQQRPQIVSLSSNVPTITSFSFSWCQWICVLLAYRSGDVCAVLCQRSRCGKAHRKLGPCLKCRFFHRAHRVRYASCIARVLVHSFHAKDSWTDKIRWLG